MHIEAAKQAVADLPMTAQAQASLRETARLFSTHYSTQIEGNRLALEEAKRVIQKSEHFPGRKRDENEVLGYYNALDKLEKLAAKPKFKITEVVIKELHALVMSGKRGKVKATPYRDGQNVIRDSRSGAMVYLPPQAKDVPKLMAALVKWLGESGKKVIPCPLQAAVAHYQFATIHPYYDGNGRTARLLATLILHVGGYALKGFYSLEEYYARDLKAYYEALTVGPSHNYYVGRAEADITQWLEYFCVGMAESFEAVQRRAQEVSSKGKQDQSSVLRQLDPRQRKALSLFESSDEITAAQVGELFGFQPRTARDLCQKWVKNGFLIVTNPSKKSRRYQLNEKYRLLVNQTIVFEDN
ncbi:MAG: Fic family protein [Deltaproteobacteria bacterium]|nr:Fic family protein [Deltaproteobacteria bacterium]